MESVSAPSLGASELVSAVLDSLSGPPFCTFLRLFLRTMHMDCGLDGFALASSNHCGSKKKIRSRLALSQKLHLAGCTIIVGAGRGWGVLSKWAYGRTYRVLVPRTRYLLCTAKRTVM